MNYLAASEMSIRKDRKDALVVVKDIYGRDETNYNRYKAKINSATTGAQISNILKDMWDEFLKD